MLRYAAFSPDTKVLGEVVAAFLQCMNHRSIAPYLMRHGQLGRHGLDTVDPERWYQLQDWLNVLYDLMWENSENASADLISIGMAMFTTINFPPSFENLSIEEALQEWSSLYANTHRGADIGEINVEVAEEGHIKIVTHVPYPDDIFLGLYYALLSRHCPEGMDFALQYDESALRRDQGGDSTTYWVTLYPWEALYPMSSPKSLQSELIGETAILELPVSFNEALLKNKILDSTEMTFRLNGRHIRAWISLRPSFGKDYRGSGSIVVLDPTQEAQPRLSSASVTETVLTPWNLCAQSSAMRSVVRPAQIAARAAAPVLLQGESGTGKSYMAYTIHCEGNRANKSFIEINCHAIPQEHMMREILGYDDPGGLSQPSQFERAHQGTLVFSHIESLPLKVQETLLYVIEQGYVTRFGSTYPIPVDVRIIGITTNNLEQAVATGDFIPQLYYRFGVFTFRLPSLRERRDDIPLLIRRLLDIIAAKYGVSSSVGIENDALTILCHYPWPGNIRELETVLESAFNRRQTAQIQVADLPGVVREGRAVIDTSPQPKPVLSTAKAEREAIMRAGWACEGCITEMAELLEIGRTTLWRKMKRMNITSDYFKRPR